jgi:hypothetical protein
MEKNQRALDYIKGIIESIGKDISVGDIAYASFTYRLKVSIGSESHVVIFQRSIIDDLEVAFEKYEGTEYFATLDSSVKFNIYISLGQSGLIGDFLISEELLKEKRQWIKAYRIDTKFNKDMADFLHEGLISVHSALNDQLEEHKKLKIASSEIESNISWIKNLIDYYNTNNNLNSLGAEIENLQMLKAAAVNQIISLELLRKQEKRPTTWRALNNKIYDIAKELRESPFLDVQLPSFIHDIATMRRG